MDASQLLAGYAAKKTTPTAKQLLDDLAACGVKLTTNGTALLVHGGAFPQLSAALAPHEAEIIKLLTAKPAPAPASAPVAAKPEPAKGQ